MAKQLGKFKYANSMTISSCRRVCKFVFGDFLFQVKSNVRERRFDVYLQSSIETSDGKLHLEEKELKYFEDNWCNSKQWHVIVLEPKEATNVTDDNN